MELMHGIKLLMLMARYIIEHVGPPVRVQLLDYSGTAGNSTGRGNALLHVAVTGIMQPEIHGNMKKKTYQIPLSLCFWT